MDDSGSESQYYAVYVVPHWDRLEVDDEEDDDDEEDVDDWGHRGYFLVGPFGVYEAGADADRFSRSPFLGARVPLQRSVLRGERGQ